MKPSIVGSGLGAAFALLTAFGCSSEAGVPSSNGGAPVTAGCSRAPACGTCGTCIESCFCQTQDITNCSSICEQGGGTSPAGTTPPPSGTTAPTGTSTSPPVGSTAPPTTGTATTTPPTGTTPPPGTVPVATTTAPPPPTSTSTPPPVNEFTLTTVPFDLPPGSEQFKCQNFVNPVAKDIAIVKASSFMAPGSHHMYVFDDPNFNQDTNSVADCSGTEFHDYLILSQSPQEIETYPAGIGRSLPGSYGLRVLMHYLNSGTATITAQVTAKFEWVETNQVQHLAAQMELNNALLRVPPGTSTQSRTYTVPYGISILYAINHMHRRATHFHAATNANQVIFDGTEWDEPQPTLYDPPLQVGANSVITWSCDFNNTTGSTLTFGESATANEMCILFALFYATDPGSPQGQPMDQLI